MNKATLDILERKLKQAKEQVEIRDDTYRMRSHKWKFTEKADRHQMRTLVLTEYISDLEESVYNLKKYLDLG